MQAFYKSNRQIGLADNEVEKPGKDPLGHPPDHIALMMECKAADLHVPRFHGRIPPDRAILKNRQRNPEAVRHLVAQLKDWVATDQKNERPDHNCREPNGPGMQIIELTDQLGALAKIDSRLLEGFAHRRFGERSIHGLLSATWERDMATPRVALIFRALNEEKLRLRRTSQSDQDSDSSTTGLVVRNFDGPS